MSSWQPGPKSLAKARRMRRSPTEAERKLWLLLRGRRLAGFKFRRQVPIGPYVADFLSQGVKAIIEVDGSQHEGSSRDRVRDAWFESAGYRVLRYWNNDVLARPDAVLDDILAKLE